MKIVNRADFLRLPKNTAYLKCKGVVAYDFSELEIKVSDTADGWGNDWITDNLFTFAQEPFNDNAKGFKLGDEFRWDENQTIRDGLYDTDEETMYAILDNEDIELVIKKLSACLK